MHVHLPIYAQRRLRAAIRAPGQQATYDIGARKDAASLLDRMMPKHTSARCTRADGHEDISREGLSRIAECAVAMLQKERSDGMPANSRPYASSKQLKAGFSISRNASPPHIIAFIFPKKRLPARDFRPASRAERRARAASLRRAAKAI